MLNNEELLNEFELSIMKKAENTRKNYIADIQLFSNTIDILLLDVTIKDINNYFYKTISDLAPASKRRKIISLNRFYDYIIKCGYKKTNPMEVILGNFDDFKDIVDEENPFKVLDNFEVKAFINYIKDKIKKTKNENRKNIHIRNLAMISMLLTGGMRPSELLLAEMDCLNLEEDYEVLWIKASTSKGKKSRPIDIFGNTIKYIKSYLEIRDTFNPKCKNIFVSNSGEEMNYKTLWYIVDNYSKESNIDLHTYTLRHTNATNIYAKNGDMEELRLHLGHSDYTNLKRYVNYNEQNEERIKERRKKTKTALSNF